MHELEQLEKAADRRLASLDCPVSLFDGPTRSSTCATIALLHCIARALDCEHKGCDIANRLLTLRRVTCVRVDCA
eukprot:COSAG05_NODE_2967_length_2458_cov_1.609580_3_plen_75_part_00